MSNYPAGMTGNEYALTGPTWEGTIVLNEEKTCQGCGMEYDVDRKYDGGGVRDEIWLICPVCGDTLDINEASIERTRENRR